jgi:hypothetical protein
MTTAAPPTLTGPLPASLGIVTFNAPAQTTVQPHIHTETWDRLGRRLTRHRRRANKNGEGWSPAIYRHDDDGRPLTRANGSVESLTCAVADVDHIELEDLKGLTDHVKTLGLAGIIYSTFSHSVTAPRVRLVIPFTEPVPAETWPRLWPALNATIFLHLADRAASDASRMYFAPATPGDETTIAEHWDGDALNWRALPLADPETVASSSPVTMQGTGPAETIAPEDMPLLERLFSGRHGEKRMRIWTGDYVDFGGDASAADQSLANGAVTYCRGDVERAERIMRAGPWRPKWDERRGSTTWLGYALGKALDAYSDWAGSQEGPETTEESAPADETCPQTVARLQRELAAARATIAGLKTNLRAKTTRLDVLEPYVADIQEILGRDEAECPSDDKVVLAAFVPWLQSYRAKQIAKGESTTFALKYGAKVVGMHHKRFSKVLDRWSSVSADDGAPWRKKVTRTRVPADDGGPDEWDSALDVTPWQESTRDILRASLAYVPKELPKKRGGSEEATAHRWGRCTDHPHADVTLKGYCTVGGEYLGELRVTTAMVDALKVQNGISDEPHIPPVDARYLSMARNGISDSHYEADALKVQPVDSGHPVSLPDYATSRPTGRPERCLAPGCRALEFKPHPDGSWRCLKSGHDPRAYELIPMAAGGSE